MNNDQLNKIMNCNCLQSVIKNDEKRYTMVDTRGGYNIAYKVTGQTKIQVGCDVKYTRNGNPAEHFLTIAVLFCPICGEKTKHTVEKGSFYEQCQQEPKKSVLEGNESQQIEGDKVLTNSTMTLLDDYKRKLINITERLAQNVNNGSINDIQRTERLKTKQAEYRTFIVELDRCFK